MPERGGGQLTLARGGVVGARWLEPADYHVTLRFIGDIDGAAARDIAEMLGDIRRPKAIVRFDGLSWFGGDKPRAIVARVKAEPALMDLQAEQERRLRRIGVEPEARKFTPHVTLARLRGVAQAAVADYLAAHGALQTEAFTAERFVLYSARDGTGGGPYVVEAAIRWRKGNCVWVEPDHYRGPRIRVEDPGVRAMTFHLKGARSGHRRREREKRCINSLFLGINLPVMAHKSPCSRKNHPCSESSVSVSRETLFCRSALAVGAVADRAGGVPDRPHVNTSAIRPTGWNAALNDGLVPPFKSRLRSG